MYHLISRRKGDRKWGEVNIGRDNDPEFFKTDIRCQSTNSIRYTNSKQNTKGISHNYIIVK